MNIKKLLKDFDWMKATNRLKGAQQYNAIKKAKAKHDKRQGIDHA